MRFRPDYPEHAGNLPPANTRRYHFLRRSAEHFFDWTGGLEVIGQENLATDGDAFMIASNHESWLDVPAHGSAAWRTAQVYLRMFAKNDLRGLRVIGPAYAAYLEGAGAEFLLRHKAANQEGLPERVGSLIVNDAAIVSFIQKSRKNHKPYEVGNEVGRGPFYQAMSYGLTIIPSAVVGTHEKSYAGVSYGTPIAVEMNADIDLTDIESMKRYRDEATELREIVKSDIRELISSSQEARRERIAVEGLWLPGRVLHRIE